MKSPNVLYVAQFCSLLHFFCPFMDRRNNSWTNLSTETSAFTTLWNRMILSVPSQQNPPQQVQSSENYYDFVKRQFFFSLTQKMFGLARCSQRFCRKNCLPILHNGNIVSESFQLDFHVRVKIHSQPNVCRQLSHQCHPALGRSRQQHSMRR
mmetsp:Transcript_9243/g.22959  ORF Transcript_9243/g.22959 Transcript_9243/m.22959 type:complete len:152 (+) Transcript_9243:230-685(+)